MKQHQFLSLAFVLLALVFPNCAQTKHQAESFSGDPPQQIWKFDTGG